MAFRTLVSFLLGYFRLAQIVFPLREYYSVRLEEDSAVVNLSFKLDKTILLVVSKRRLHTPVLGL